MAIQIKPEEAVLKIKDRNSLMIGGFLGAGVPLLMIDQIVEKNIKDLTIISVGAGYRGGGVDIGKLALNHQIKKYVTSHVGTDPNLIKQIVSEEVALDLSPMGTFIERIRAAGAGLGAVVTPVGLGTEVEDMADKIVIDGKDFLLFKPIKADVAIIKAARCDKMGNLEYHGISNTNPVMATAADIVIAEVEEIVEVGEIKSEAVGTAGIFVDYYVQGYSFEERKAIYEDLWIAGNKI
ncbi:MAG: acetate CoA/acetoacetate CoA-transferase alpha subunit [Eubacteriaceae bacterium]|jgi:acetate CoA/acetoacetate CoA-transferase alpha subunit|nr:acetate CoA/acetoacetate CoA-transferase alpha subunit [Eubacteriaceae bacterium]MDN5306754.1 acetate CoA/acetoacetate CoA-transferase alpha subunit [Eubacteriaceae bacterium]